MVAITNVDLYNESLALLQEFKSSIGRSFKGRFIQVFLGLKFYQNSIPSMYSGSFIRAEVLQTLLDDLYSKSSLSPDSCVLALFERKYFARTGLIKPGNSGAQNTWRNNLNLQKGIGCYATHDYLSSPTFLNNDRLNCQFLVPSSTGSLADASCSLCHSQAKYRGESHRKWLQIDPGGNGYAVTDLQNIDNFLPYLDPTNNRIPILPLIIAIYHDSNPGLVIGSRKEVSLSDFMSDFNFSKSEIIRYFDISADNKFNKKLIQSKSWDVSSTIGTILDDSLPASQIQLLYRTKKRKSSRILPSSPNLVGTVAIPPESNTGWDAEQYVLSALNKYGWSAFLVSRQQLGYDIYAQNGRITRYIEVKSSLGLCSPLLTAREWQQAKFHKENFVLAVIENFDTIGQNMIYWIPDPSNRCISKQQETISQSITRSSWRLASVPLSDI